MPLLEGGAASPLPSPGRGPWLVTTAGSGAFVGTVDRLCFTEIDRFVEFGRMGLWIRVLATIDALAPSR